MHKQAAAVFSSQNAFAALETKKSKKKKSIKDKEDKGKKDKVKSTDAPNGFAAAGSAAPGSSSQAFGGADTLNWADDDSDDDFAPPMANWIQVRSFSTTARALPARGEPNA
jgi:hypothetical protein